MAIKMPERTSEDGPVSLSRPSEKKISISISVETNGQMQTIEMGDYNAWRVFGLLAHTLNIPLSDAVKKAIKF